MHIGARLETIGKLVPINGTLADIGTDHAYLPVWLIQNKLIHHAIAADIAAGPCQAARATVNRYGLSLLVDIRQGSGFSILEPGEVGTVVLAGMGAATMVAILDAAPQVVRALNLLILQPMNGASLLRKWAQENGFYVHQEKLCRENDRFYVVMTLKHCFKQTVNYSPLEMVLGPCLLQGKSPFWKGYLEELRRHYEQQRGRMQKSETACQGSRYQYINWLCQELEVLLNGDQA